MFAGTKRSAFRQPGTATPSFRSLHRYLGVVSVARKRSHTRSCECTVPLSVYCTHARIAAVYHRRHAHIRMCGVVCIHRLMCTECCLFAAVCPCR